MGLVLYFCENIDRGQDIQVRSLQINYGNNNKVIRMFGKPDSSIYLIQGNGE